MIYVNGTELATVNDIYLNGSSTTPNYVYCNGTLV